MNNETNNLAHASIRSWGGRVSLMCVGLMAVLPFTQPHHTRPITEFYTEFVAFALGLMALSLLLSGRYWRNLALPWIILAPLGLFAVLLLQLNLKMPAYYETQVIALFYLLWATLLIILGSILRQEFGLASVSTTLAYFFLVGGELSAFIGLIQHYDAHSFLDSYIVAKNHAAVYGNIGQTNHFANHISLALASLVFLFDNDRTQIKLPAWAAILLSLPLLFVLPLSASRSPWLYLSALLVLALLFHMRTKKNTTGRKLVITSLLLIAGYALMQWLVQTPWFAAPLGTITPADRLFEQAGGTAIRFYLWREAWQMFLQSPLLGIGWGQYAWHHFHLMSLFQNPEMGGLYNQAHNLIMQLLAETGLLGTLPVVGGIAVWLIGLKRQSIDIALWWLLSVLAIIGIHSMLEFPLWYGHFLGLAAFLLGMGESRFISLQLPRLGRLAVLLLLASSWSVMFWIERDYRQLEQVMRSNVTDQKYLNKADIGILQKLHQKTLLSPHVDFALASAMELNQDKLDLKLAVNRRVMRFIPNGQITYKQSILLALKGEREAAIKQAEQAATAYPGDFELFAGALDELDAENPGSLKHLLEWVNTRRQQLQVRKP